MNIKLAFVNNDRVKIKLRDFSECNVLKFKEDLANTHWDLSGQPNIDSMFCAFDEKVSFSFEKCFPLRTKEINCAHLNKPWITPAIKISIKKKSELFKLFKLGLISRNTTNTYKNELTKV